MLVVSNFIVHGNGMYIHEEHVVNEDSKNIEFSSSCFMENSSATMRYVEMNFEIGKFRKF